MVALKLGKNNINNRNFVANYLSLATNYTARGYVEAKDEIRIVVELLF
jgi:hypothetical protein